MKRTRTVTFGVILIGLLLCTTLMAGCTGNSGSQTDKTTTPATVKGAAEGVLSIAGSTTVLPIAAKVAEKYMGAHPETDVQVNGGGTGAGVQAAGEGTAMIGMASRDLKEEELKKYPDLIPHQIAIDGLVFITNADNPIPSLTLDQIKKIYDGNITNWKDVGGKDAPIVVVGRDSASGTRDYMSTDVMKKADFVKTQLEKNSNGAVKQTIEQTPNAIGYVGLGYIDQTIHAVPISVNGTLTVPSIETVKKGTYPLSRPLHLLTKGQPTGDAAKFIAFLETAEGQKIITEEGFITIIK
ncbi:MAG: phosphate ABC transporter substrate-binding protein [Methanospirillum sp.]|uniref:phosphate ABC transporter substrate-binding protein n=1 Tax=Methanospirillum sp. TaxID=45200 RepID=UPI002371B620|nr:phosphate ABC transporter substrate-binding protein [Methanospirillum sp.]MDD1728809.1 phosphate ABC transporter substrate-binding protein [Methanospirillum sp.]